jgi:hypothetical protein
MTKAPKKPAPSQKERFKEAARQIGADESGEAFERAFKKMVPAKRREPTADK